VLSDSTNNPVMWLLRLPTWLGLLFLAIPALLLACKPHVIPLQGSSLTLKTART
jgi:hypothetical protein